MSKTERSKPQAETEKGPSQALKAGVRKYGRGILANLTMSLKTSRLYGFRHPNVAGALKELRSLMESFIGLAGDCRVSRIEDSLFLNDVRLKVDCGSYQSHHTVLDVLRERDVGEVVFTEGVSVAELESLTGLLNRKLPETKDPWQAFEAGASKLSLPHVQLRHKPEARNFKHVPDETRPLTMGSYFKTISIMDSAAADSSRTKRLDFKKVTRAIQNMVDLILNEKQLLLALVNVKGQGAPGSNHAVNVAILSVALGAKLGLSKKLLSDLGFAALLHDTGKMQLPENLRTPCLSSLEPPEQDLYRTHVFRGVEKLVGERLSEAAAKSAIVAFLHHYRYDRTGYPKLLNAKEQNLYARIVAVADFYDNATTPERLRSEAMSPDAALRALMERGGTEFDPVVVKAFIHLMGLYPVGCMVRLTTGEVATVTEPPSQPRFLDRPTVKIHLDAEGQPVEETASLLERDGEGKFRRSILKLYQQEEVKLELSEYLAVI